MEKFSLQFGQARGGRGAPGNEDDVAGEGKTVLMETEDLPQEPLRTVAPNGVADAAGGDEAGAPQGGNPAGPDQYVETKKSALPSYSGSANFLKVGLCFQMLFRRVPHGAARRFRH